MRLAKGRVEGTRLPVVKKRPQRCKVRERLDCQLMRRLALTSLSRLRCGVGESFRWAEGQELTRSAAQAFRTDTRDNAQ